MILKFQIQMSLSVNTNDLTVSYLKIVGFLSSFYASTSYVVGLSICINKVLSMLHVFLIYST